MKINTDHLYEAAARFFTGSFTLEHLGSSSGYSGSHFARVEDHTGRRWCLRGWPEQVPDARLVFMHWALLHSRANGFSGVPVLRQLPSGDTFVRLGAYRYEVQSWLPGKPCGPKRKFGSTLPNEVCPLSRTRLLKIADALGRFHQSLADLRPHETDFRHSLDPHFLQTRTAYSVFKQNVRENESQVSASPLIQKWLGLLPQLLNAAQSLIEKHPDTAQAADTLCHGDLWPSHVFFDGTDFAGFVDFESLTYASPVTDLAQLILHFNGWESHKQVLQAYQKQRALRADEINLLPLAALLDLVGEACWSIEALCSESASPHQQQTHQENLRALDPSAQRILEQMNP